MGAITLKNYFPFLLLMMLILATPVFVAPQVNAAPLQVTVTPDKSSYNPGEQVVIVVTVELGGSPVSGASVFVSIETPDGALMGGVATETGPGWYQYQYDLLPTAGGGTYTVGASADKGADSGSDQNFFSVFGVPVKKSVDWQVYNPSHSPANPSSTDFVRFQVLLGIVQTISPAPYSVNIVCSVDGILVGGGTINLNNVGPITVNTDPRKFQAGLHNVVWEVDPNYHYNDGNRANNRVSYSFTVTPQGPAFDFSITISPTNKTIALGDTTTFDVNVKQITGTGNSVSLKLTGLPDDIQSTFSPQSNTPDFISKLQVDTSASTSTGTYTITVFATGGGKNKTAFATLMIEEADFTLTVDPNKISINQGDKATFTIDINPVKSFDKIVTLSASGIPDGAISTLSIPSKKPPFKSSLIVDTSPSTPEGIYPITMQAEGGTKKYTANVTLIVEKKPLQPSSLSLSANFEDGEIKVFGRLSPPVEGAEVTISYKGPEGKTETRKIMAPSDGSFTDIYKPEVFGEWEISTSWPGNEEYESSTSPTATVTAQKQGIPDIQNIISNPASIVSSITSNLTYLLYIIIGVLVLVAIIVAATKGRKPKRRRRYDDYDRDYDDRGGYDDYDDYGDGGDYGDGNGDGDGNGGNGNGGD